MRHTPNQFLSRHREKVELAMFRVLCLVSGIVLLGGCSKPPADESPRDVVDPPTIQLAAEPTSVQSGGMTNLTWSVVGATTCSSSGDWSGDRQASGAMDVGPLNTDSTFTLTCNGEGGQTVASVNVSVVVVPPPVPLPTVSLSANPTTVESGGIATLGWSSQNANGCVASSGWSGSKGASGSQQVGPLNQSADYQLTCTGDGGSVNASVTITVVPPSPPPVPSLIFSAAPDVVASNGSAVLQWSATNADECVASGGWTGPRSVAGSETVGPLTSESTFRLDCTGQGGSATQSVTVTVSAGTGGARLRGAVDSSLVNREGANMVYVFAPGVTPDDKDGDAVDPIVTGAVLQENGGCGWSYDIPSLAPGTYTVAFTNQAALDSPVSNDALVFAGTEQVTVGATETIKNFVASRVLKVGPTRSYHNPSDALADLQDGDVVEVDAGEYPDDIVVWRRKNLTLRGVGGRAHMKATRLIPYTAGSDRENGMGIWVTKASKISVENIEFSGAKVPDANGAGIRAEGPDLTVCGSYFHDNENGILGGSGTVWIEHSEFNHNGLGEYGRTHNLYIGDAQRLVFQYNYSHHAHIGHNLKSRAAENHILYNRLMDESDGDSSYIIDTPNGGLTYIIGNLLQQGPAADNSTMVAYGAEGLSAGRTHKLYVVNNTLVNDRGAGTFLSIASGTVEAKIVNNLFVDNGTQVSGPGVLTNNLMSDGTDLEDRQGYDYHLLATSTARNAGSDPGIGEGLSLNPEYQYVHPMQREVRHQDATLDIGAFEFAP